MGCAVMESKQRLALWLRRLCALALGALWMTAAPFAARAEETAGEAIGQWRSDPGPGESVSVGQSIVFTLTMAVGLESNGMTAVRVKLGDGLVCQGDTIALRPGQGSDAALVNVALGGNEFVLIANRLLPGDEIAFAALAAGAGELSCTLITTLGEASYVLQAQTQGEPDSSAAAPAQGAAPVSTPAVQAETVQAEPAEGEERAPGETNVVLALAEEAYSYMEANGGVKRFAVLAGCLAGILLCTVLLIRTGRRMRRRRRRGGYRPGI